MEDFWLEDQIVKKKKFLSFFSLHTLECMGEDDDSSSFLPYIYTKYNNNKIIKYHLKIKLKY